MYRFVRMLSALAAGFMVLSLGVAAVAAQEGSPPAGGPPLPEGCEVIATDLLNPRFIAIADDGTIYVTEAGTGGDEVLTPAQAEEAEEAVGTPVAEDEGAEEEGAAEGEEAAPVTRGDTGRVTAISPDGTQSVVAEGFVSYSIGSGPAGIVLGDGVIWVSVGGGLGEAVGRQAVEAGVESLEGENSVFQIDVATGEATLVSELGSFEEENNPDETDVNPNLYGMDLGADGQLYVADAGGNTVYRVDPATGEFALLGVVPGPTLPGGEAPADGTPAADEAPAEEATPIADEELGGPPQSVPTGVHVGADGNVYVATLGAFIPGGASVQIAQADGSFVEAAAGLSTAIGVALGPDGALYVSQLAGFEGGAPGPGSVVRIGADGTVQPVVEGVPTPHGIAFDADGNLYVVANSTALGPPTGPGQVWRCDGIAAA